ncbi:hypothetical protein HUT19_34465 [Streptomyces sp. NA02950]|uniref:hypothetical protein n=1 Tax=Streptomyces sp. NA02950 TaxID=2742137 RepID=UPI001590FAF9|nr:hypothetical protein [Streptomyces sp. NA02950]QKV96196.1 hypothetical protein HUT19_34465 [Streptomyces sp. NA02950]
MSARDRVLAILDSPSRETFLIAVGHRLGISARDIFTDADPRRFAQAQACNEIMISIWSQLWATKESRGSGYPDPEFLSALLSKADAGDARTHLRHALESALRAVHEAGTTDGS